MTYRLIEVSWIDACSHDQGWMDIEEAIETRPTEVKTVGWVISDRDDCLIIAPSVDFNGDRCFGTTTIPKGWIKSIRPLP